MGSIFRLIETMEGQYKVSTFLGESILERLNFCCKGKFLGNITGLGSKWWVTIFDYAVNLRN